MKRQDSSRLRNASVRWMRPLAILLILAQLSAIGWARESTDLSGQWRFRLDPADAGEAEKWFTRTLPGKIQLPGSLQAQGFGDDPSIETGWIGSIKDRRWFESPEFEPFRQPGHVKIPCWLQPEKHYVGAAWRRIMEICRAHGLNHLRFHSWCPPEAAFRIADELGFYLQVELPTWAYNMGKDKRRDEFLSRELDRIIDIHGNHPSFILMSMGNELRGEDAYLTGLVEQGMRRDSRRLYACTTHHHRSLADQFRITMRIGAGRTKIRGMRGPGTDWDFSDAIVDEKIPVIAHEIGQFCVWPDLEEIEQYTGLLKARNFELFRERLADCGMLEQARDFLMSSGKLQALCYKEEIESMLRTPGFGGFQLLDLHDFPGQGTSPVGILNAFWNQKGYIAPEDYRRFCDETVPLARITKRIWTSNETLTARIELAHFGESDLAKCSPTWTLSDNRGKTMGKGQLPAVGVPAGGVTSLGEIKVGLDRVQAPTGAKLSVSIPGTTAANDWNLWVYPDSAAESRGEQVIIAAELDEQALAALDHGGRVVQVVPDWNAPRREALLFECKVGPGRLLMCSTDLSTDLGGRPAARQLRRSLLDYAAGKHFDPATGMTPDQIRALLVVDDATTGDGP